MKARAERVRLPASPRRPGAVRTIYWLPGWGALPRIWQELWSALPEWEHRAASFRGAREPGDLVAAARQQAPDVPYVVAGWSLGGTVALAGLQRSHPLIRGLILLAATPRFCHPDPAQGCPPEVMRRLRQALTVAPARVLRDFGTRLFSPDENAAGWAPQFLATTWSETPWEHGDWDHEALRAGLALLATQDLTNVATALTLPVLWIHGTADAVCPFAALQQLTPRLGPNHRQLVLPDAGHVPFHTRRPEVVAGIREFLDGLASSEAAGPAAL